VAAITTAFVLTAVLYTAAGVLYFVHLARGGPRAAAWAARLLATAVLAHLGFVASNYLLAHRSALGDIQSALSLVSLLITVTYLVTMRSHRLAVLGAFITPVALLLFLGSGLRTSVPPVPEHVRSALLPLHVAVNLLGIVAFALAFAAAVGYVIQEQLLRRKHVFGVFQRLPALDVLDDVGLRLVTFGFPLFTLGLITGTLWLRHGGLILSTGQGFAIVAWGCFGSVLLARAVAGWRGRRAAIGTMLGFLCAIAALAGYLVRDVGGG